LKTALPMVLLLAPALLLDGCSWFRRGPKSPPPPPTQATQPTAPIGPAAPKQQKTPVPRTSPAARKKPQPALKPQPADTAATEPAREPVLGQLITPEQTAEYRRAYDVNSAAANRLLNSFTTRTLEQEQVEAVARIRSFLQQATEAKSTDLSLAASLARRAAVLARELAERLQ
jgi:hypothetical protein